MGTGDGPPCLRHFVDGCHQRGLKILFDAIVCHTAPNHAWLTTHPEWFNVNRPRPDKWWIWGLPDLNHDLIDLNFYFAENLLRWIEEADVDAVRIDATRHVETHFWQILKLFTKGLRPNVTMVGEVWDQDVAEVAPYQTRHGFDSMLDYPLYHAMVDVFVHEQPFARLARPKLSDDEVPGVLDQDGAYRNPYHLVTFLDNHDTPRFFHLAGGRAQPEVAMVRVQLALAFLFTTRGIPQLYYGSELALDGGPDPDNRRDMPWALVGEESRASVEARQAREMRDWVKRLIALRRGSRALRYGLLTTLYVSPRVYAFARTFPGDLQLIVLNNGDDPVDLEIPLHANPRLPGIAKAELVEGVTLLNALKPDERATVSQSALRVRLPAKAAGIYHRP